MRFRNLQPGEPLPHAALMRGDGTPFSTLSLGGRYVLFFLAGDAGSPEAAAISDVLAQGADQIAESHASFITICTQADASSLGRARAPHDHVLVDADLSASQGFGAAPQGDAAGQRYRPLLALFDPMLRLIAISPARTPEHARLILTMLERQPPPASFAGRALQAPILYLPRVFPPDLCADLIRRYQAHGGAESGFMRMVGGKTVGMHDPRFKMRRDYLVEDPALIALIQKRIGRAVLPEIRKAYAFEATRMERYVVGCYRAQDAGHFAPHRDNTTSGTAHRRFAISINLNEDFEGGEVAFPEYGPQKFKASAGAAVVFGCALLHTVSRVTKGERYAFLPFVYDEAAARIREANLGTLA